jgi:hypothetical protein
MPQKTRRTVSCFVTARIATEQLTVCESPSTYTQCCRSGRRRSSRHDNSDSDLSMAAGPNTLRQKTPRESAGLGHLNIRDYVGKASRIGWKRPQDRSNRQQPGATEVRDIVHLPVCCLTNAKNNSAPYHSLDRVSCLILRADANIDRVSRTGTPHPIRK